MLYSVTQSYFTGFFVLSCASVGKGRLFVFSCCCCCLGGMFTANTMSSVVETLGLSLPGVKQKGKKTL